MSDKSRPSDQLLPPITFKAAGGSDDVRQANLEAVLPSPGYPTAAILMADAITKRADVVLLDFTAGSVSIRYQVDGIWHQMPDMDRATGDYMLASLKKLADLDYRERRERQAGQFQALYMKRNHPCRLVAQGVATGERVAVYIERAKPELETLQHLGMRKRMHERVVEIINGPAGIVLFAALPGDGLSSGWRGLLQAGDRFLRDYYVVQEKSAQETEVINVTGVSYDAGKGETALKVLPSLLLREPNVVAFAEIGDGALLNKMCDMAQEKEIMILTRLPARHAIDALLRALVLKPDVKKFASTLKCVLAQRLVRRLCEKCKRGFVPDPALLQKLGLPPTRVNRLYTHFQPLPEELVDEKGRAVELEPCSFCGGPGYRERTAIFELLIVNDALRKAIVETPTLNQIAAVARQAGHISLRDEGIVLVAQGVTSLEELQRVLKK